METHSKCMSEKFDTLKKEVNSIYDEQIESIRAILESFKNKMMKESDGNEEEEHHNLAKDPVEESKEEKVVKEKRKTESIPNPKKLSASKPAKTSANRGKFSKVSKSNVKTPKAPCSKQIIGNDLSIMYSLIELNEALEFPHKVRHRWQLRVNDINLM